MSISYFKSHRQRLPNRRAAKTFDFEVGGQHYRATIGRFPETGLLAEIFLSNTNAGSAADTAARDSAIVCSLALQHGADVEMIRRALCRDAQGRACGPLSAALDMVAEIGGAP
jgi:hypothetical protein